MAFNYQRGDLLPVQWQALGGALVTVSVQGYDFKDLQALYDVTHTGHLGTGTARLAGKPDFEASMKFLHDADIPFYGSVLNIRKGLSGLLLLFISPIRFFQEPTAIESIHGASSVETALAIDVTLKQNVGQGGGLVVPVIPTS